MQVNPSALDIPDLLRRYGLRPDKRLGQNFLIDQDALHNVVEAADIQKGDAILEIGSGLGNLTRLLAGRARRVVTVELDKNLIPPLQEVLALYPNVTLLQGDILAFDPMRLMQEACGEQPASYLVVANIPYYITSTLIRHLLESGRPPGRLVLTVQREVAERICAKPGKMSLLTLSVQIYGNPSIVLRISPGAFYPPPKVESAVVRVDVASQPCVPVAQLPLLFRLAKAGFSQKRKTLRNSLSGGMRWTTTEASQILEKAGIDPQRRAETLSIQEWSKLAQVHESSTPKD